MLALRTVTRSAQPLRTGTARRSPTARAGWPRAGAYPGAPRARLAAATASMAGERSNPATSRPRPASSTAALPVPQAPTSTRRTAVPWAVAASRHRSANRS
jgi:hypothetical protein